LPTNKESKLNMWADDIQIFIRTIPSFKQLFKRLETYEKCSESQVNYVKTKGILLGTWRNKPPTTGKITSVDHIKAH
jgi:hypothetical protein